MRPNRCPKCRTTNLDEHDGGATASCPTCGGMWVRMQDVPRVLAEAAGEEPVVEADPKLDAQAGMCPAGHGILTRARIEGEKAFTLERCPTCFGIWFDR